MVDVIIIGCGVVGAACAYELSRYDIKTLILEADNDVANGATKANSAIIHAGYDPVPGTDMARLNVAGSKMAREICEKLDVPYRQIGSFVLAFSQEDQQLLHTLLERGQANGVQGVELISGDQARAMEPELSDKVTMALWAPTAAIVNPWEYCFAMAETAVKNGVELKLRSPVTAISKIDGGFSVKTATGTYEAKYIVNAAGTHADEIHELIGEKEFTITPAKGEYYLLDKSEGGRCGHVIFQCPTKEGKGVLVSPTTGGNLIVGPNAEGCGRDDVANTAQGLKYVRSKAVMSIPAIAFRENIRNFAGVRANSDQPDFIIGESRSVKGFINAAGICSPGLSSAPAIGVKVREILEGIGLEAARKADFDDSRRRIKFKTLSPEEQNRLIELDSRYGRVICRCETVTEGEIVASLHTLIPPVSINGVKRRVGAGMGRCQGGFCGPRVQEIIARELNMPMEDVLMDSEGTYVLTGQTKGEE